MSKSSLRQRLRAGAYAPASAGNSFEAPRDSVALQDRTLRRNQSGYSGCGRSLSHKSARSAARWDADSSLCLSPRCYGLAALKYLMRYGTGDAPLQCIGCYDRHGGAKVGFVLLCLLLCSQYLACAAQAQCQLGLANDATSSPHYRRPDAAGRSATKGTAGFMHSANMQTLCSCHHTLMLRNMQGQARDRADRYNLGAAAVYLNPRSCAVDSYAQPIVGTPLSRASGCALQRVHF